MHPLSLPARTISGLSWLLAVAVTVALTAALAALHANASVAAIVYLVFVVWIATVAGRGLALATAVACSFFFDYFFLEPLHTLNISGFQGWLSMFSFVAACIIVSRVANRARNQTLNAEQRREDVERLNMLSQEMMIHEDAAGLVREIPLLVERNFALEAVLLYVRDEDRLYSSRPGEADTAEDRRDGIPASAMKIALRNAPAAHEDANPEETNPGLLAEYASVNLVFGMNSVGTLAWKPTGLSREVATSIAAQVAIAITRAHAIEASTRLEAARAADRLRAALIDSLTHELRTPLTAIRAAASTLTTRSEGQALDSETRDELAAIIDEESQRLDLLIGEAMEIAEIESDGIRFKPEPLHAGTFLEQAVEQSRDLLAAHRVSILVKQPDDPVWFDPHLLGRALRHLLENAARYSPPNSRILLESRRTPGRLEFRVEDDGPGIDALDLPLVFEKFYRGRQGRSKGKGTGMGLAITRALVAAHGGSIDVSSAPGRGTTFRFWIPVSQRPERPTAMAATGRDPKKSDPGATG
jgi:two-component system, OmpR family, sensor histidine kinase KdpD